MSVDLMVEDKIVMTVLAKYATRSKVGQEKYGTTLDLSLIHI